MADRRDPLGDQGDGTHRGGFGEFGGDSRGLIDRAFRERIVLAGVTLDSGEDGTTQASLEELARLVDTAGADTVARVIQKRDRPDRATYVGRGRPMRSARCPKIMTPTPSCSTTNSPLPSRGISKPF